MKRTSDLLSNMNDHVTKFCRYHRVVTEMVTYLSSWSTIFCLSYQGNGTDRSVILALARAFIDHFDSVPAPAGFNPSFVKQTIAEFVNYIAAETGCCISFASCDVGNKTLKQEQKSEKKENPMNQQNTIALKNFGRALLARPGHWNSIVEHTLDAYPLPDRDVQIVIEAVWNACSHVRSKADKRLVLSDLSDVAADLTQSSSESVREFGYNFSKHLQRLLMANTPAHQRGTKAAVCRTCNRPF